MIRRYKIEIAVDTEDLRSAVDGGMKPVAEAIQGAVESEFEWLEQSGIRLIEIEEIAEEELLPPQDVLAYIQAACDELLAEETDEIVDIESWLRTNFIRIIAKAQQRNAKLVMELLRNQELYQSVNQTMAESIHKRVREIPE